MPALMPQLEIWQVIISVVDVIIVAYVFYKFFMLIRGTRSIQLLKGLAVVFIAYVLSDRLNLQTTRWLLNQAQLGLVVALPIVFQPELRRALEQLGRGRIFARSIFQVEEVDSGKLLGEVIRAVMTLSRKRIGAIIVFERETGLEDIAETGIKIDGMVSSEFLVNIFVPNTPLHDGAVLIRGSRVVAAACFLPLAEEHQLGPEFGSRHRAAIGITEHSDAIGLVVSEETGIISLANGGKLVRNLDEKTLREMLQMLIVPQETNNFSFWPTRKIRDEGS